MGRYRVGNHILGTVMFLAVCSAAPAVQAGFWQFTKVVDINTPAPGGVGNFSALSGAPAISGGRVYFSGSGGGKVGLWSYDGVVQAEILSGDATPGGGGAFFNGAFGEFSFDGNDIAFTSGVAFGGGTEGVFARIGGTLMQVADTSTLVPNGVGTFADFFLQPTGVYPAISGGNVAFMAQGSGGQAGVYVHRDGMLERVADTSTPIPGASGHFAGFDNLAMDDERIAFRGLQGSFSGIYTESAGVLSVVADENTVDPTATLPAGALFDGFGRPSLDDGTLYFGANSDRGALFSYDQQIDRIIQSNSSLSTGQYAVDQGAAAFGSTVRIFHFADGLLSQVFGPGDTLEGVPVFDESTFPPTPNIFVSIGPQGIEGNSIAFHALINSSDDYNEAIYLATFVPEPAAWTLAATGLACALGALALRRRLARPARCSRRRRGSPPFGAAPLGLEPRRMLSVLAELNWVSGVDLLV